ncbi:ATP-binding cassette domain-containing protein, partial [Halogeometricum sp. CBA1124]|uniref:ATP-binding cassette domain-containing protein n=1 Tax=Halogeometricum sp. CBA1124 TaxID=2668071 RepID=UPI0031B71490
MTDRPSGANGVTGDAGDDGVDGDTAGRAAEPTIRVSDLDVELGGASILSGVNLSVDEGSFVGLIGPNGAGKTT